MFGERERFNLEIGPGNVSMGLAGIGYLNLACLVVNSGWGLANVSRGSASKTDRVKAGSSYLVFA